MSANRASPASTAHVRCRPPEPVDGESIEETLAHYQQALVDLAQCFDDELSIRPESSLLSRVVLKILLPFAAVSAVLSAFYVAASGWAKARFAHAEYAFGLAHLLVALALLGLWIVLRQTDRFPRARHFRGQILAYLDAKTPKRNETITRNRIVNHWLYFAFLSGFVFFIPFLFFLFRADVFNQAGLDFAIDTAGICAPGQDGISFYRGSETCAAIDGAPSGVNGAQAEAAEIRLDATSALTLYAIVLGVGILVSMAIWWRRNRTSSPASLSVDSFDALSGQR